MNIEICLSFMEIPKHCRQGLNSELGWLLEEGAISWEMIGVNCLCTEGQEGRRAEAQSRQAEASEGHCACACLVASAVSDSLCPYGLWASRPLCPWDSPGKSPGVGCHSHVPCSASMESSPLDHQKSPWFFNVLCFVFLSPPERMLHVSGDIICLHQYVFASQMPPVK